MLLKSLNYLTNYCQIDKMKAIKLDDLTCLQREIYLTHHFSFKKSNIFPFFEGKKEREGGGGAASIGMLAHRGCPSHLAIVCLPIYICHLWWSSHQSSCLEPLFCGSLRLKLSPLLRFPQSSEYIVSPGTVFWDVTSYSAGLDF